MWVEAVADYLSEYEGLTRRRYADSLSLLDWEGRVVKRFAPSVEPADIAPEIEALL